MSESSDEKRMGRSLTWRDEITVIAGPYKPSDTRESWLARAARKCRISFRQTKALWYGECVDPKYSVAMNVRCAADQARQEAQALASRFETIASGLNEKDADFYRADIAALIDTARALRGLDSAGVNHHPKGIIREVKIKSVQKRPQS